MSATPSRPRTRRGNDPHDGSHPGRIGTRRGSGPNARRRLFVLIVLLLLFDPAPAEELDWGLCHAQYPPPADLPKPPAPGQQGRTLLSADVASALNRNVIALDGNVEAVRDGERLEADSAVYLRDRDLLRAEGSVRYLREGLTVTGTRGRLNLGQDTGHLEQPSILLYPRHARGRAERVVFEDKSTTRFDRMQFTTCDPGRNDWLLKASRLRLDQATGTGVARNVTLSVRGVPILYSPYLSFPIDDRRKSGFLSPSIGDSSENGLELEFPYYLNLAPNYDATLTPRYVSRRGMMLDTETRYLTRTSEGLLGMTGLPDDDLAGRDRYLLDFHHVGQPTERIHLDLQFRRASDRDYFRDLGNDLGTVSITHLEQHALLNYQTDGWTASGRLQAYQTIDDTIPAAARPYRQLPILAFRTHRPEYSYQINPRFVSSYVNFRHDERLNGSRIDLQPALTLPMYSLAAFAQPTVTLRHTSYDLDPQTPAAETMPDRTLPIFTFDSGLYLERDSQWGGVPMLQTLEPRLFYLYVPYRGQSELPRFDTGLPDFNYTQLFRDNRFNGADRIGDANQVSLAVTTRFLQADSGRQRAQFSIGQIYHFQDREVTLDGTPDTAEVSDVVAEGTANLTDSLSLRFDARRSEETGRLDKGGISLQYRPTLRSIFNISYRYRDSTLNQSDLSLLWPLGARWHLIGRHNYSYEDERILETLAGVEYQSCCWRVRFVNRRYVNDDLGDTERSFHFQVELKGLGNIGSSLESLLEHGILGYRQ